MDRDTLTGGQKPNQTPHFGAENNMKGIETLANDIRHYEVEVAQWKKGYTKLQNVCNLLFDKLGLYMDSDAIEGIKNTIREMGIEVN